MRINERYYLYIDNGTQVPIGDGKKKAQYRIGCLSDGKKKKKKKKKNEEEGVDKEQQSPSSIGKNIRSWLKDVDEFWEGMKDELGVFFEEEEEQGDSNNNRRGEKVVVAVEVAAVVVEVVEEERIRRVRNGIEKETMPQRNHPRHRHRYHNVQHHHVQHHRRLQAVDH